MMQRRFQKTATYQRLQTSAQSGVQNSMQASGLALDLDEDPGSSKPPRVKVWFKTAAMAAGGSNNASRLQTPRQRSDDETQVMPYQKEAESDTDVAP